MVERVGVALVAGLVAGVTALFGAFGEVHADGYRYWSYWRADGASWSYATTGPSTHRPKDGSVDGWRFTSATEAKAAKPRLVPDFGRICAGVRIRDGYKRIGVVLDYGTSADAPPGAKPPRSRPYTKCVVVASNATSTDVLNKVKRTKFATNGLLCSIGGYPSHGCGEAVSGSSGPSNPSESASNGPADDDGSSNTSTWIAIVGGVVIAVALLLTMSARRRSGGGS